MEKDNSEVDQYEENKKKERKNGRKRERERERERKETICFDASHSVHQYFDCFDLFLSLPISQIWQKNYSFLEKEMTEEQE